MRPDPHVFADHHLARTAKVRDDGRPERDLRAVAYFYALGIFVLDINVVSYKDMPLDFHSSQSVEKRPQCGASGTETGAQMENAVERSSKKRFIHAEKPILLLKLMSPCGRFK
ncbi:MAG: hypothetical protein A4E57_04714 [Syntrophorhabdaceae bacterium PtaU1.Bin034]|nr:MAG: hypothetical protein A4E57_04714 [Syntrophorhabdaceae bacterium PtaU1.Bin034]